jgi:hypothetical protein
LEQIRSRLFDELGATYLLSLNKREQLLFAPQEPLLGAEVEVKFPSLRYEVEETGKCLALGRSTAAAFHAIRCLEGGIRAISRCLGIPDPTKGSERSWHKMLAKIKDAINKHWPASSDRMSGDGEQFENLYASLSAMQNPWRNATMHLDQKYTLEEANEVLVIVRRFMRQLASRCDETGAPRL